MAHKIIFSLKPEVDGWRLISWLEYASTTTSYDHGVFETLTELGYSIHERVNKLRNAGIDIKY